MNLAHATTPVDLYGHHYRPGEFLPFYVPREFMPQVDDADAVRLILDAASIPDGAAVGGHLTPPQLDVVDPRELHAHQRVDHARAQLMDDKVRAKPIIVSADGCVLDGNHRWWAHVHAGSTAIAVIRLALDFDQAIPWMLARPYVYAITPNTPERN